LTNNLNQIHKEIGVYNFYCKRLHLDLLALFAKKHVQSMDFIQKFDSMTKIKDVKCPILILHSQFDRIAPCENSMELAKQNKNAQLYISQQGNHWDVGWCLERVFEFTQSLEQAQIVKMTN